MGEIDLDGPQPLFEQVADVISGRIEAGTYPIGRRIPAVRALADEFGVSQSTAEAAARLLRERGLTRATHGRGTFVIAKPSSAGDEGEARG